MTAQPPLALPDPGTLLSGERKVLELIAIGTPLADTLDALCRVIDDQTDLMCAVYLLNREGDQLSLAAGPRLPDVWRNATRSFRAAPTIGACGAAVNRREQVITPDVLASPLFEHWRDAATAAHIGSVFSTPFFSTDGHVLGTFVVFAPERGTPNAARLAVVAHATHLASIAVERHLVERDLRESEIRFSRAFYANPAPLMISSLADGRLTYVNDAFVRTFGYSRGEAVGHTRASLGLYADPLDERRLKALLLEGKAREVEIHARTKSGEIRTIIMSLERIEVLGEDSTLCIAIDITERNQASDALQRSEALLRLVLDAIPVGVLVIDDNGNVILSNPAAARIWGEVIADGATRYATGKGWWHDSGRRIAADEWASVRARRYGETSLNEVIDIETFDGVRKIIQNSVVPIRSQHQKVVGAVVVNEDITARKGAESALQASVSQMRTLATHLMHAQDDERRRIAQMLHETTAQDLAALKMLLARLGRSCVVPTDADRAVLDESVELAERSMRSVRTLSYLLHPPFLDEAGLLSALRWYAKGFADRSGIAIDLDVPATFGRLPQDVETTLFRVVQEALTNVHRHARSSTASIRLKIGGPTLILEIEDRGRGMSPDLVSSIATGGGGAAGIGIAGMRERLEQLGGALKIETNDRGTMIRATVPLPAHSS